MEAYGIAINALNLSNLSSDPILKDFNYIYIKKFSRDMNKPNRYKLKRFLCVLYTKICLEKQFIQMFIVEM